jgi:hypothetical protein
MALTRKSTAGYEPSIRSVRHRGLAAAGRARLAQVPVVLRRALPRWPPRPLRRRQIERDLDSEDPARLFKAALFKDRAS